MSPLEFTFHEWMDATQSVAMVFIVFTQITIIAVMRGEMRRAASAMQVMSRAMGEAGELSRRVQQVEDDVAELVMMSERAAGAGPLPRRS